MKSTDGNTDVVWPQVSLPKHRRSACRAEMHPDLSRLLSVADIDFGWPIRANMLTLEKGNNAEHRAGAPLTLATMAGAYGVGIGGHFDTQGTTRTTRGSRHSTPPSSIGLTFPNISATRKMAERPEDRHVVPGHPPLCDLSAFDAEHCPEIKLRLPPRRWKSAHWPLLRALIRGPCSDEIPPGDQKLDRKRIAFIWRLVLYPSIIKRYDDPAQAGIQFKRPKSLDSRLCGNDEISGARSSRQFLSNRSPWK